MIHIICEAGVNFRNLDEAFQFIDESKRLGLFATKFQLFEEKQIQEADPNIQDFLRTIQLTFNDARDLWNYGQDIGQEVFFSVMFLEAVDWCERIGVKYYKIRYKDRFNSLLIKKINNIVNDEPFLQHEITVYISVDKEEIPTYAMKSLNPYFEYTSVLKMHCIPKYPAQFEDYRILEYPICHLFSDHTDNTKLIEFMIDFKKINNWYCYIEKHMRLDTYQDCLEKDWSVTFSQLEEVLNK